MDFHPQTGTHFFPSMEMAGSVSLPPLKRKTLSDRLNPFFEIEKLILEQVHFQTLESYLSNLRTAFSLDQYEIELKCPWLVEYPALMTDPVSIDLIGLAPQQAPLSQFLAFLDCWSPQPKVLLILPTLGNVFRRFRLLAEHGFAMQGKAIPLTLLLEWLDLEELQRCTKKLYGRRAYSPRKRELIEVLIED